MKKEEEKRSLLSEVVWRDASLNKIVAEYDSVTIELTESNGRHVRVKLRNHIALHWTGHWDENIVESCVISQKSEHIDHALKKITDGYGEKPELGGGTRVIGGPWFNFSVKMIDGVSVSVVAQDVDVEIQ